MIDPTMQKINRAESMVLSLDNSSRQEEVKECLLGVIEILRDIAAPACDCDICTGGSIVPEDDE